MVGRKDQRKQSKEALAKEVRKHFNNAGIIESEVVVDFLYKVRWQGTLREDGIDSILHGLTIVQIRTSGCGSLPHALPLDDG